MKPPSWAGMSVESPEIFELVRSFGIDYAQGFTVGRPLPEIPSVMRRENE